MKLSIIIPVYNVKPYLRQCVDSVLAQTYQDLEIILVDDGSTDGSGQLADELCSTPNSLIACGGGEKSGDFWGALSPHRLIALTPCKAHPRCICVRQAIQVVALHVGDDMLDTIVHVICHLMVHL